MIRQVIDTNFQQNTNRIQLGDITMLPTDNFNSLSSATDDEIRKLIIKSSDRTCFLDPMPTRLVKAHIDILVPTITKMVTEFLLSGPFSNDMKKIPGKPCSKET